MEIRIKKIFGYRKARVQGTLVPEELMAPVWEALPPRSRGNHIVVIARIIGAIRDERIAIQFSDGMAYVGGPNDVIVR